MSDEIESVWAERTVYITAKANNAPSTTGRASGKAGANAGPT